MKKEQKPSDYGIERQIWTGKTICEVIQQRWQVELKDSRIYDILKEIGLSYQLDRHVIALLISLTRG